MLREYIVVDLEMTGLRPARDKILEIGAVYMKNGKIEDEYQTLVNPKRVVEHSITELTGITQKMADTGMEIKDALEGFLVFARGLPLVGHNVCYDYQFLKHNAVNNNLVIELPVLDTLKIARKQLPDLEKKTLHALCEYFGIVRSNEHRALDDARATGRLLEVLIEKFGEEEPVIFKPYMIQYKVKKQGPITPKQKKYLKELAICHKIDLPVAIEDLTKSEASRLADRIISKYGKGSKIKFDSEQSQ